MTSITVNTDRSYEIILGKGILQNSGEYIKKVKSSCKVLIVTDDNVKNKYCPQLEFSLKKANFKIFTFCFKHGEQSKNITVLNEIYETLAKNSFNRSDLIIALGGGVVGDITGFAAATFLRGIEFVQIPTTFLAQIDSSIGGKTGINLESGKNLVGSFYQPSLVICDVLTLNTLTPEIFADGTAEAIKYGLIKDSEIFNIIESGMLKERLLYVIETCIKIKRDIVEVDEFDNGVRMLLNFGHTLGHAIEKHSGYKVSHGKAVGCGMCLITKYSTKAGITKPDVLKRVLATIENNGLISSYDAPIEELLEICLVDKKVKDGNLRLILIKDIGVSDIFPYNNEELQTFFSDAPQA